MAINSLDDLVNSTSSDYESKLLELLRQRSADQRTNVMEGIATATPNTNQGVLAKGLASFALARRQQQQNANAQKMLQQQLFMKAVPKAAASKILGTIQQGASPYDVGVKLLHVGNLSGDEAILKLGQTMLAEGMKNQKTQALEQFAASGSRGGQQDKAKYMLGREPNFTSQGGKVIKNPMAGQQLQQPQPQQENGLNQEYLEKLYSIDPSTATDVEAVVNGGYIEDIDQKKRSMVLKFANEYTGGNFKPRYKNDRKSVAESKATIQTSAEIASNDYFIQSAEEALKALEEIPEGYGGFLEIQGKKMFGSKDPMLQKYQTVKRFLTNVQLGFTGKTKGAISDKEMETFAEAAANSKIMNKEMIKSTIMDVINRTRNINNSLSSSFEQAYGVELQSKNANGADKYKTKYGLE